MGGNEGRLCSIVSLSLSVHGNQFPLEIPLKVSLSLSHGSQVLPAPSMKILPKKPQFKKGSLCLPIFTPHPPTRLHLWLAFKGGRAVLTPSLFLPVFRNHNNFIACQGGRGRARERRRGKNPPEKKIKSCNCHHCTGGREGLAEDRLKEERHGRYHSTEFIAFGSLFSMCINIWTFLQLISYFEDNTD